MTKDHKPNGNHCQIMYGNKATYGGDQVLGAVLFIHMQEQRLPTAPVSCVCILGMLRCSNIKSIRKRVKKSMVEKQTS
jgi:hypothetical protein